MMKHNYLICGAGSQGQSAAYRLARFRDTANVAVCDVNEASLKRALDKISYSTIIAGVKTICGNPFEMPDAELQRYNVAISAMPADLNYDFALQCLRAGVHYCDLGGKLDVALKIRKLHAAVLRKNLAFVPECGLQPGLGNVFAVAAESILRERAIPDEIVICVGGLPKEPGQFPHYKKLFNLKGLEYIVYDPALVIEGGRIKKKNPLSESVEKLSLPGIGEVEALVTGGLGLLPYFMKDKVAYAAEKTIRWPGFWEFVKQIPRSDFIRTLEATGLRNDPDFTYLETRVSGHNGHSKPEVSFEMYCESDDRFTSMEKTSGFAIAHAAHFIAQGKAVKGVYPMEQAFPPLDLIAAVRQDFEIKTRSDF